MSDCGLTLVRGRMLYGYKHGFGYGWLPDRIQGIIVAVWNFFACFLLGHHFLDYSKINNGNYTVCVNCCKRWDND